MSRPQVDECGCYADVQIEIRRVWLVAGKRVNIYEIRVYGDGGHYLVGGQNGDEIADVEGASK